MVNLISMIFLMSIRYTGKNTIAPIMIPKGMHMVRTIVIMIRALIHSLLILFTHYILKA
jgi:hypothetical protein